MSIRTWNARVVNPQLGLALETFSVSMDSMSEADGDPDSLAIEVIRNGIGPIDLGFVGSSPREWRRVESLLGPRFRPVTTDATTWVADTLFRSGRPRPGSPPSRSPFPPADRNTFGLFVNLHLDREPLLVLDESAPSPKSMLALTGQGALLIAGLDRIGPIAVVLVPAGMILLRLVDPIADGLTGAIRRFSNRDDD